MNDLLVLVLQIKQLSEELQLVRSERDALQSERTNTAHILEEEQEKLHSRVTSLAEERDQLQEILEGVRGERSQLKRDVQEKEEMVSIRTTLIDTVVPLLFLCSLFDPGFKEDCPLIYRLDRWRKDCWSRNI